MKAAILILLMVLMSAVLALPLSENVEDSLMEHLAGGRAKRQLRRPSKNPRLSAPSGIYYMVVTPTTTAGDMVVTPTTTSGGRAKRQLRRVSKKNPRAGAPSGIYYMIVTTPGQPQG